MGGQKQQLLFEHVLDTDFGKSEYDHMSKFFGTVIHCWLFGVCLFYCMFYEVITEETKKKCE